jgi:hypothetical protein
MVMGTADYLAPEQAIDSHGVDIRADIYGLGLTFYFLLAGKGPFEGGTTAQKLIWQQIRQPEPLCEVRPEVPREICDVVERMTAKEPAERYQTPVEVAEALAPWTATPIDPPSSGQMPRAGHLTSGAGNGAAPSTPSPGKAPTRPVSPSSRLASSPAPAPAAPKRRRAQAVLMVAAAVLLGAGVGGGCWLAFAQKGRVQASAPVAPTTSSITPAAAAPAAPVPPVPSRTAWVWSSYDAAGALVNANVATGTNPRFLVPAGQSLVFVANLGADLSLDAPKSAQKVTFAFSATAGLSGASGRPLGFGLFSSHKAPGQLEQFTGYFVLWNAGGPYFESYARSEGKDLFAGKQLGQGGKYEGILADSVDYTSQFQLNRTPSGDGISIGTNSAIDLAGAAAIGPNVNQTAFSKAVTPLLGEVSRFDSIAFRFTNTSPREATLALSGLRIVTEGDR